MNILKKLIPHKEIGWTEIGEKFTRYQLLKSPLGNIYLHQLYAPNQHPHCHDHPWSFIAIILWGGYWEYTPKGCFWRGPGSILFRPAEFVHNVVTRGTNWSIVVTGPKRREWGFRHETDEGCGVSE